MLGHAFNTEGGLNPIVLIRSAGTGCLIGHSRGRAAFGFPLLPGLP